MVRSQVAGDSAGNRNAIITFAQIQTQIRFGECQQMPNSFLVRYVFIFTSRFIGNIFFALVKRNEKETKISNS